MVDVVVSQRFQLLFLPPKEVFKSEHLLVGVVRNERDVRIWHCLGKLARLADVLADVLKHGMRS